MAKTVFKITVTNWKKHNEKHIKKSHKKTLIANNFCTDAKLLSVPMNVRWLFLHLVLMCGEQGNDTVTMTERQLNDVLETRLGPRNGLGRLQSFQLVTWDEHEICASDKRKEKKRKEMNISPEGDAKIETPDFSWEQIPDPKPEKQKPPKSGKPISTHGVSSLISRYCEIWKERYRTETAPPISGRAAGGFKTLVKDFGLARATELVEAYLRMPDTWFLTKRHDIQTLLGNLNTVAQFADNGKILSRAELRAADSSIAHDNLMQAIEKGLV